MKPKSFSLALWWWAARWFAHIWVYKYLEEKNLFPQEVSWTSMWAIIAACIAIKLTSSEIEKIIKDIKFFSLIDADFKTWLIKWEKIKLKFKEIFWKLKIEDCKIPLKIVATNLENWEKYIFSSWYIYDALRASVSIPWVIAPYKYKWALFVDWWISSNLPIEILSWKNIIAVSVLRDLKREINYKNKIFSFEFKKWLIWLNYQILQKTIDIMMKQNEDSSLSTKWKNITYIHPSFPDIDYYEFNKYKEIIEIWYKEMENMK